jgi:hypothetical protein
MSGNLQREKKRVGGVIEGGENGALEHRRQARRQGPQRVHAHCRLVAHLRPAASSSLLLH